MPISLFFSRRCWPIITFSLVLAACSGGPKFKSTDITGVDYGKALELADTSGRVRHLADFRGKAVVLFFGFTHCPDVCPTTLADLAGVMKTLGPDADRVQVLFVTVDPERDTPQDLDRYV
ncbi:MAG: SCO family protein, partial [Betaproteobacteria bacterium]